MKYCSESAFIASHFSTVLSDGNQVDQTAVDKVFSDIQFQSINFQDLFCQINFM